MYPNGQNMPSQPPEPQQDFSPYQPQAGPSQPQQSWSQPTPQPQQPYARPIQTPNQYQSPAQQTPLAYTQNPQPQYVNQMPQQPQQPQAYAPTSQPPANPTPNVNYMGHPTDADQQEYSIDYLNKIAPKEQKTVNKFAMFGLVGAGIFVAIFAFAIMLNPGNKTPDTKAQTIALSERIATLETATEQQQKNLNEEQIYAANTAINSSLGSMSSTLTETMKASKIKENKKQKTAELAYSTKLNKTLNDAYQRGTLDRTYTTQMTYELSILRSKLVTFKKSKVSTDLQNMSSTGIKDIDSVMKTLNEFGATKS